MDMKKKIVFLLFSLSLLTVACSSDDDGYNADTAVTTYEPKPADSYRMVSKLRMSMTDENGRLFTFDYTLSYDAHNRIKAIDGDVRSHTVRNNRRYNVNITSKTEYQFKEDNVLRVIYNADVEYPQYSDWNTTKGYNLVGEFNQKGALSRFAVFDCEYSGLTLSKAYVENGRTYSMYHDRHGNVTGYVCDSLDNTIASYPEKYKYTTIKNNTNIDFSGFIGNWVPEREIYDNENWIYAFCHLAAFDMLGARSLHLPEGEWTADANGYPVKCILPSGIVLEIEYVD